MAEHAMQLLPGAIFSGRYEVLRCLSAGGMGAVYEVLHQETRRRLALKVMLPALVADPGLRARFKLEATIAAEIESDHIVHVYDAGIELETDTPFIVMELLKGEELSRRLKKSRRLAPLEVVALLEQVALALEKTHAAGIVHRDLKPENLFVARRDDGSPHVKILDFGIAKIVGGAGKTTQSVGTPLYMPPEQIRGDPNLGPAADLYALAHIAFALLVGGAYFEEEGNATESLLLLMMKIAAGPSELPTARAERLGTALPTAFDAWFARAASTQPEERFRGATEMVRALAVALDVARPSLPASTLAASPVFFQPASTPVGSSEPRSLTVQSTTPPFSRDALGTKPRSSWGRVSAVVLLLLGAMIGVVLLRARVVAPVSVPASTMPSAPVTASELVVDPGPSAAPEPKPALFAVLAPSSSAIAHPAHAKPAPSPNVRPPSAPSATGKPKHDPLADP